MNKKAKDNSWKRTGTVDYKYSFNKGGIITYAQEQNDKGWTRFVAVGYKTVEKEGD